MIARAVRIDARRPASWIALGAAVAVAAGFPAGGAIVPALACGGLLVVAAVGDLLPGTPRDQFAGARIAGARILARSIWPLVGLLGGGAAVGAPRAAPAANSSAIEVSHAAAVRPTGMFFLAAIGPTPAATILTASLRAPGPAFSKGVRAAVPALLHPGMGTTIVVSDSERFQMAAFAMQLCGCCPGRPAERTARR